MFFIIFFYVILEHNFYGVSTLPQQNTGVMQLHLLFSLSLKLSIKNS